MEVVAGYCCLGHEGKKPEAYDGLAVTNVLNIITTCRTAAKLYAFRGVFVFLSKLDDFVILHFCSVMTIQYCAFFYPVLLKRWRHFSIAAVIRGSKCCCSKEGNKRTLSRAWNCHRELNQEPLIVSEGNFAVYSLARVHSPLSRAWTMR